MFLTTVHSHYLVANIPLLSTQNFLQVHLLSTRKTVSSLSTERHTGPRFSQIYIHMKITNKNPRRSSNHLLYTNPRGCIVSVRSYRISTSPETKQWFFRYRWSYVVSWMSERIRDPYWRCCRVCHTDSGKSRKQERTPDAGLEQRSDQCSDRDVDSGNDLGRVW